MRVLIVDDEPMTLNLLARYLQQWGHEPVRAGDGAQAYDLFQRESFPMVITDWTMPVMSGIDLVRRIRGHARGAQVYAVLLTGRAAKEDVVAGMEAGADDFLAKPFDRDELRVRVREGERIVELEQRRVRAEARCQSLEELLARHAHVAEHELERALAVLGASAPQAARDHVANARNALAALRHGARA